MAAPEQILLDPVQYLQSALECLKYAHTALRERGELALAESLLDPATEIEIIRQRLPQPPK